MNRETEVKEKFFDFIWLCRNCFQRLDRQNVVADRDIQTPMGQMEYTHGHQGQSVVRGGQVVFQRKLAIATAQIVYTDLTFLKSE